MNTSITPERWHTVRTSLRETGDRFAELVSAAPEPDATAIGTWSVAETAAHVAAVALTYNTIMPSGDTTESTSDVRRYVRAVALDEVTDLNEFMLRRLTERDPGVLAERIHAYIDHVLRATEDLDPSAPMTWLGNAQLPVAGCCAHLLNELLIHGRDIAGATGAHWEIPQREAAMAFELFLIALLRGDTGRLLSHEPISTGRVAVQFRSRHTTPVVLTAQDGRISVSSSATPVDVRLFFEPAALMLMLFGRLGKTRTALTGKAVVWGRRPWLLPTFFNAIRFP